MRQKRNRFPRWKIVGSMLKLAAKAFIIYSFIAGLICWYYPSNTNIQQLTRLQYKLNKADSETWRMYYSSLFLDYQQKEVRAIPYITNPISVFRSLHVKEVDPDVVHVVKTVMRSHKKHLFEIDLTKLDISSTKDTEQDFSHADFHNSNLEKANMQGTILVEVNFLQSNLRGANLTGANLSGADLRGTNLTDADFKDADLTGANFQGADLRGACFDDAIIVGADFSEANIDDTTSFNGAKYNSKPIVLPEKKETKEKL